MTVMTPVRPHSPAASQSGANSAKDHLAQLDERLQQHRNGGMNPALASYLESLLASAQTQRPSVRKRLLDKVQKCLQEQAASSVKSKPQLMLPTNSPLAELIAALNNMPLTRSNAPVRTEFDDLLKDQDLEQLDGLIGLDHLDRNAPKGLTAHRRLNLSRQEQNNEHLVRLAIERAPQDPGPLNSHKLVINAMAMIKALSPRYARRLVAFGESMLWLEEADLKQALANRKNRK